MTDLRTSEFPVWCKACSKKLDGSCNVRDHWNKFPHHYSEVIFRDPNLPTLKVPESEVNVPFKLPLREGWMKVIDGNGDDVCACTQDIATALVALANRSVPSGDADQMALSAIEHTVGDDFCEDLDCIAAFHPETMSDREKSCHDKLSLVYKIAHSHRTGSICYDKHDDWRKLAREVLAAQPVTKEPKR